MPHLWDPTAPTPDDALRRLVDGNRRFREGRGTVLTRAFDPQLATAAQRPFAIVLGCSDSRTPVELVFDQGFGELFVVRVAGHVVAPSIVGSIEFAASQFGSRLVVVMGHTRCGAVAATLGALETGLGPRSRNIRAITERIEPHVEGLLRHAGPGGVGAVPSGERLLEEAVRANVRAAVDHLRHGSRIVEELVTAGRLVVVGAEYALETGAVEFFDAAGLAVDGGAGQEARPT